MNTPLYVWVLMHMTMVHHIPVKEYQSTFRTQDRCNVAMVGMNQADPVNSWYCEKHIAE